MQGMAVLWLLLSWAIYKMMWGDIDVFLPMFLISAFVALIVIALASGAWELIKKIWKLL